MDKIDPTKVFSDSQKEYVLFELPLVQFVDRIIDERIRLGRPTIVKSEDHWRLIEFIIKGWDALYPEIAEPYYRYMKDIQIHGNRHGVSREKGGATIQNLINIPQSLFIFISKAFPAQKWDKEFVMKFARRLPIFKGAKDL